MDGDDFDYGDLAVRTTTAYAVKADVQFISGTVLLVLGILGSFLVYVMLLLRRNSTSVGIQCYAFFLVTCNLLNLVNRIGNYPAFPFVSMMPSDVSMTFATFSPLVSQWFNIVYCWLTTFLFFETIIRSRLSGPGFHVAAWLILCSLFTIAPGVYIGFKFTEMKYIVLDPEPHIILQLVGYILVLLTLLALLVFGLLLIISRKKLKEENAVFSVSAYLGILAYGLITIWWQFPAGYEISTSLLQSKINPAMMVEINNKLGSLVIILTTSREYAMLSISAIITWSMLVFLPGISFFGVGNRKNMSSNRIGDSGEKIMTAP